MAPAKTSIEPITRSSENKNKSSANAALPLMSRAVERGDARHSPPCVERIQSASSFLNVESAHVHCQIPLAPTNVPDMPANRRVNAGDRGRRDPLQGPHRRAAGGTGSGHHRRRGVLTPSKCPSAPEEWCRAQIRRPVTGPRAGGEFRHANAFTGQTGRVATTFTAASISAKAVGCKVRRGLPRLDRRHRRAARRRVFDGVMGHESRVTMPGSAPPPRS